jgi:hypothetical protein
VPDCPTQVFILMLTRYLLVHELYGHALSSKLGIHYTNYIDKQEVSTGEADRRGGAEVFGKVTPIDNRCKDARGRP